ncbi:MAG: 1-acyl-sn-glycerol-3-phosphate acyltransferase [Deltaproteobacteria bacterium]|jgi:1-acyl-sn-glycerol-3-phosphate acyltransferase|nr:1-acyl-sn-glycerol-3-phosphate acyltransferase [Deltaproteobacteria bacterium]
MRRFFFCLWYAPIFAVFTILTGLVCLTLSFISKKFTRRITSQGWAHVVLDPAFIKVKVTGQEHLPDPQSGGYIIFANHRSLLDIPTVAVATGRSISWVAKAALGRLPVFGWTLKRVHLLVDRGGSPEAAKQMVTEATVRLNKGEIMAIFPEGTRNKTVTPILPFKKGAFILAKHTGVPLIPLAIYNSGALWPSGSLIPKSGTIKVAIGPPIVTSAKEPLTKITKLAEKTLSELYHSLEAIDPPKQAAQ